MNTTNQMKDVVEEGLGILTGDRLRVSLADCSIDRLRKMLQKIDAEAESLREEMEKTEAEVLELYARTEDVELHYEAGRYIFPIDRNKERLIELRDRIQSLVEKRKPIYNTFEEKYLMTRQAKILGGERVVKLKNGFIFVLILVVLALLGIDAGNVGAPGEGARLRPVVVDGAITAVEIEDGGQDYVAAGVLALSADQSPGSGAEIQLEVENGRISSTRILSGGRDYDSDVTLQVRARISPELLHQFWIIDFCCCLFFLANFFFELVLANSKRWYWKTHWVDFITSIPLPPAQVLAQIGFSGSEAIRAGRLLRVIRLLRALRALRLFLFMWRGLDHLAEIFDVRLMKKSFLAGLFVLALGALLITLFGENGEGHEAVNGFLPGLWWSFTTLVTGGFGDIYNPETLPGRLLTVFLVVSGMVLVGVFTATLTTVLVGREERAQNAQQNELLDRIQTEGDRVEAAIARIEERQEELKRLLEQSQS